MTDQRHRTIRIATAWAVAALLLRPALPDNAWNAPVASAAERQRLVDAPPAGRQVWPSRPPKDCPFEPSKTLTGVLFTGVHSDYHCGDTWYPSWAADGNQYSPWTDGRTDGVGSSSGGLHAVTGNAVLMGDDPLRLTIHNTAPPQPASPRPYEGRYPCGSLVYNGIWYYGTYCLGPAGSVNYQGFAYNWPVLGPMPGFRISRDYGKTWTPSPLAPDKPLFPEPKKFMGPVKMGCPHFVDFGKNLQYSPDGKAYLLGMGAEENDPKPRYANLSWITADQIYLARVTPSPENINDLARYEFFAGHDAHGKPLWSSDFARIRPLLDWNNNMGCATATYDPGLKKYLMCVTDGWPTCAKMSSYILEADQLTGPWRLVVYMKDFGEQGYFLNFPSKFISADGKTLWLCYSANFAPNWNGMKLKINPPGGRYGLCLHELRLLAPGERPKLSWNSPKVLEVKKEVESLETSFASRTTKSNYADRVAQVGNLLRKRLSHQEMSELAEACSALPVDEQQWSEFEHYLFLEMASVFLESGDRESVLTLFSTRFPSGCHFGDIECLLVCDKGKLKYPVLILGDAYANCQVPEVRSAIAQAVRRAFKGSGIRGNDDADFVMKAMQWYGREKDHLVPNLDYAGWMGGPGGWHTYFENPLFERKAAASGNQAGELEKGKTAPGPSLVRVEPLATTTNSIGMKMVLIPAGKFTMGSPEDEKGHEGNEFPEHPVRITRPFWLGAYEVTQAEYDGVMGKNPSFFSSTSGLKEMPGVDTKRFPVETISWYDAIEFCNRLSKKEGLPEYYRLSDAVPKHNWRTVKIFPGKGYRLPTEAEWEYACRAGTTTPFSFGTVLQENQARVSGKVRLNSPVAVGSYPPNAFGLYDMHGNVPEFCHDRYEEDYYADCPIDDPINDPPGSSDGWSIVTRGGDFGSDADFARSAWRGVDFPWSRSMFVGFRLARGVEPAAMKRPGSERCDHHP